MIAFAKISTWFFSIFSTSSIQKTVKNLVMQLHGLVMSPCNCIPPIQRNKYHEILCVVGREGKGGAYCNIGSCLKCANQHIIMENGKEEAQ